jgi:dTDP-glucose pyrophosphorylase
MKNLGIQNIVIVIGHYGYKIVELLGDGYKFGVNIEYVEQKTPLGIAHAVGLVEGKIENNFLLFLGDIFFLSNQFGRFTDVFRNERLNCLLAAKIESEKEKIKRNFAIIEDKKGFVCRVIEKPRYVTNNLKGCGLYIFDQHIFDAIRRTPRTAMRDEYEITDAIQILVEDGFVVKAAPVIEDDLNLTSIEDLLSINMKELKKHGLSNLISSNAIVKNKERIVNSVIGDNVQIDRNIEIVNSVVFPNVNLSDSKPLKIVNSIVTTAGVYQIYNGKKGKAE